MKRKSGTPSGQHRDAPESPTPAGRTRQSKRAEHERKQGPARACTPKSARPDQLRGKSARSGAPGNAPPPRLCEPSPRAKLEPPETLNQKGAIALAKKLEQFWHDQGYPAARFWAEPIEERFEKLGTYEVYRVASNLVNGLPPRYKE